MIQTKKVTLQVGSRSRDFILEEASRGTVRRNQAAFDALLTINDRVAASGIDPTNVMGAAAAMNIVGDAVLQAFHALAKQAEPDLTIEEVEDVFSMQSEFVASALQLVVSQTYFFVDPDSQASAVETAQMSDVEKNV